jgi:hypothetical protein
MLISRYQGRKETVTDSINDLQLLARCAYTVDTSKPMEVIMDRIHDGLAASRLRQCFETCTDEDLPFLAKQKRQIHRVCRDKPKQYHAVVDSALHRDTIPVKTTNQMSANR